MELRPDFLTMTPSPELAMSVEMAKTMLRADIFFREDGGRVLFPIEDAPGKFLCCFVYWKFDGDTRPFMQTLELSNEMNAAEVILALEAAHIQFCENIEKYKDHPELIPKAN